jgi:hypothetical protein
MATLLPVGVLVFPGVSAESAVLGALLSFLTDRYWDGIQKNTGIDCYNQSPLLI